MAKLIWRFGTVLCAMFLAYSGSARSQIQLADTAATIPITLRANETLTVDVRGAPGTLEIVEIRLEGGLVWIQSPQVPRRLLDLGRGGHLAYAVEIPSGGWTSLELKSGEHLREVRLGVQLATHSDQAKTAHLRAAEVDFAIADSARRRLPGAPGVDEAFRQYDRAAEEARQADDLSLLGWIVNQKARFLLYQKSNFAAPHDILKSADALPVDDPTVQALTYKTLSSCEYFMGHLDAAVAAAEHALALYKQSGDIYWQDVVLGNLIADYSEMGRNTDATRAGLEALTDAEQVQDTAGVVYCLTELANLYRLEGNPQAAFQAFREADSWSHDISYAPLIQADIERALGGFYLDMGLWAEAQREFERCLHLASPDSQAALEAQTLLAQALAHGGAPAHALQAYAGAIATARKLKLLPEETAFLTERSAILLSLHETEKASQDAEQALQAAQALKEPRLEIAATLAEAAVDAKRCERTGDCGSAEQMYRRAIALMAQASDGEQETIAYAGLAQVSSKEGHNEVALQLIEHALMLVERSRASLSSNMLAASYFSQWRDWYSLAEQISLTLDRLHSDKGYREIAFRYTERARARAMLDAIGEPDSEVPAAVSPELQRKLALNREAVKDDEAKLLVTGSSSIAPMLEHLYLEQDQLAAAETGEQRHERPGSRPLIATLRSLQQEFLGPGDALVSFSVGPKRSERWLITSSSVQVTALPGRDTLVSLLRPLNAMLLLHGPAPLAGDDASHYALRAAAMEDHVNSALELAGDLLLDRLPVRVRHLYIIADGSLSSLPWSALRTRCGAKTCYAVQRLAISMEPSASIALALARRPAASAPSGLLLVSESVPPRVENGLSRSTFAPLPGSRREVESIARLAAPGTVHILDGRQATLQSLRSALGDNPAVLHLAAHTFFVPGHPELSGVALYSSSASQGEAVLWMHDIPQLHAPPLVTLSGCSTQGGSLDGEELKTLTQALFYAGSQEVVASLWNVDDNATAKLMDNFYRNLLIRRADAAHSLRRAQLQMISNHAVLSSWAAFTIDGVASKTALTESARN